MKTVAIPDRFPAAQGDLGAAQLSRLARLVLGCRLAFDGRLDPALLERAVRLLLDAEPVLGCTAMREKLTTGEWVRCRDLDAAQTFSVMETDDPSGDGFAFYCEELDPEGPRLAVRLFRGPDGDELIVKFDHLAGDGFCAKHIPYTLADTYSHLAIDPSYVPAPNLAPRPGYRDIWAAMTPEQQAAASEGSAVFAPAKWKMRFTPGAGEGMFDRRFELSPQDLHRVREYGRARGATLNDVLLTAMFRALAAMYPPNGAPLSVSVTTDGRRVADDPSFHRPCNLSTTAFVAVPSDACDSFDGALSAVVEAIRPQKARYWSIKESCAAGSNYRFIRAMMGFFTWLMRRSDASQPYSANIGILDETRLRFGGVVPRSAHVLGATMKTTTFAFTTSTYRDTMTVWIGGDQAILDPALAESALAGMNAELISVAREHSSTAVGPAHAEAAAG